MMFVMTSMVVLDARISHCFPCRLFGDPQQQKPSPGSVVLGCLLYAYPYLGCFGIPIKSSQVSSLCQMKVWLSDHLGLSTFC